MLTARLVKLIRLALSIAVTRLDTPSRNLSRRIAVTR